jgi:hypothetical protein
MRVYMSLCACVRKRLTVANFTLYMWAVGARDGTVCWGTALQGRGFDSRWCHWNFYWHNSHYGPGIDSASNRNGGGDKGGWCVGLTTLPLSCVGCLEIWEPKPPGTLRVCPGLYRDCFTFFLPLYVSSSCNEEQNMETIKALEDMLSRFL